VGLLEPQVLSDRRRGWDCGRCGAGLRV